ncbi:hypothetical protein QC762_204724 [Podospora pseudocomata]|uniref:Extracellular membrane protein CFEM domain-containing protein n=1 Tax=Podospora pseudocomata TaxID=2093779 RepID=A0ABR0GLF1_9PEZI|nr:hypothetical protein QC762_204724 [Podospora pseudocomata]
MRLLLLPLLVVTATTAQRIFINQVPLYSSLPPCAEAPLSNIVRNMVSGCGDGGRTTSYSCFCASSSIKFESIISRAVSSKCMPSEPEATASALAVFDSYCHLSPQAAPTQTAMFPPAENRPLFSNTSESVTAASSSYEARVTGGGGGEGSLLVQQRPGPGTVLSSPSRTQLAPIPSASIALSGGERVGTGQWLAFYSVLWGLSLMVF